MMPELEGCDWLRGVRVVDFSWLAAGPTGTLLLALLGADVIRVESRRALDSYRRGDARRGRVGSLFTTLNAGKRSITVNLKTDAGRRVVLDLVRDADLVVENFTPGTMDRLGVGYPALREHNPDIVLISASAAGQDGPNRSFAGYAPIFTALGGLASLTGYEDGLPALYGRSVDARVGVYVAIAGIAAVLRQRQGGGGGHLDVSDQEVVAALIGDVLSTVDSGPPRHGNTTPGRGGEGCYPCAGADQWVMIELTDQDDWQRLVGVVGADTAAPPPQLGTAAERWEQRETATEYVTGWTSRRPAAEVVARLQAAGVGAGAVRDAAGLYDDEHLRERGFWRTVTPHAEGDAVVVGGLPMRLDIPAAAVTRVRRAPGVGEHTDEVLRELGLSDRQIEDLRAADALT
jgi:benzylsuccinate CoA-transferase BbsF subunit